MAQSKLSELCSCPLNLPRIDLRNKRERSYSGNFLFDEQWVLMRDCGQGLETAHTQFCTNRKYWTMKHITLDEKMDLRNYVCEQLKAEISEEEFTFLDMKMYKSKFYPCRAKILQTD